VRAVLSLTSTGSCTPCRETGALVGDGSERFSFVSWHETADLLARFQRRLHDCGSEVIAAEIDAFEGRSGALEIN